jgi:Flp pilus assembly protein TadG
MKLLTKIRNMKGQSMVEFTMVVPFLAILLGVSVDFGNLVQRKEKLETAAREGARLATQSTSENSLKAAVEARAKRTLTDSGINYSQATFRTDILKVPIPNNDTMERWFVEVETSQTVAPIFGQILNMPPTLVTTRAVGFYDDRPAGLAGDFDMSGFEGGLGNSVVDSSGNENNGIANGARYLPGKPGIYFDGVNDNVELPFINAYRLSNDGGSVGLWFYADEDMDASLGQDSSATLFWQPSIYNWFANPNIGMGIYRGDPTGPLRIRPAIGNVNEIDDGYNKGMGTTAASEVQVGQWNQVTMTWTASQVFVYLNGVLAFQWDSRNSDAQLIYEGFLGGDYEPQPIILGGGDSGGAEPTGYYGSQPFHGFMAGFEMYNRTLTAEEVANNAQNLPT